MWNDSDVTGGGFFTEKHNASSPSVKEKGPVQRIQSVVPVCVRQLRNCESDEFKLFGIPTAILTLVGILRGYEVQSTKAVYQIEDHTGNIDAIWWLENDANSAPNLPLVKEGCYLRVYGQLRVQENKKLLMVARMCPVENINEITTHLLEVIDTRLEAQNIGNVASRIPANNPGINLANSMSFMSDVGNDSGLNPMQQKVFNILKPVTSMSGLSTSEIVIHFPPNQRREVMAALEFLISEGHAYSTIDNSHFKVTESM